MTSWGMDLGETILEQPRPAELKASAEYPNAIV